MRRLLKEDQRCTRGRGTHSTPHLACVQGCRDFAKHLAGIMRRSVFERPLACLSKASRGIPIAAAFTHEHGEVSCGLSAFRVEAH